MRQYLLGLFLLAALLSSPAHAQMQGCQNLAIGGMGQCSSGGAVAPSFQGPGDIVSGATAWYGLRAYNAAYANANGKLVNIVRASDSHACDVLAASSGGMGLTANCSGADNGETPATFCNATTCSIATAYDQTGNGNNLTQATAANQPALTFNCLGSLPCIDASAGTKCLSVTFTSIAQPVSHSIVANRTANTTTQINMLNGGNGPVWKNVANTVGQFYGSFPGATASDTAWHAMVFVANGGSAFIDVDGTQTAGASGAGTFPNSAAYGMFSQTSTCSATATAQEAEAGFYPLALTNTQANNLCHNQFTYWGTSTSC